MTIKFTKLTQEQIDRTLSDDNPGLSAPYQEGSPYEESPAEVLAKGMGLIPMHAPTPNVTIRVNKMPDAMLIYHFPCGESSCYAVADHEFQFANLDDDYRMPICAVHAQRLEQVIESYNARKNG